MLVIAIWAMDGTKTLGNRHWCSPWPQAPYSSAAVALSAMGCPWRCPPRNIFLLVKVANSPWQTVPGSWVLAQTPARGPGLAFLKLTPNLRYKRRKGLVGSILRLCVCVWGGVCYRPIPKLLLVQGGGSPSKSSE